MRDGGIQAALLPLAQQALLLAQHLWPKAGQMVRLPRHLRIELFLRYYRIDQAPAQRLGGVACFEVGAHGVMGSKKD